MTQSYAASSFNVMVNNGGNIITDGLTKEQLKSLYLGYQLYLKGQRIKLVHVALKTEAMTNFTANVLGMSTREYSAYWRRKLFSGKGIPPREFEDQDELINFIEKNENTIGVLGPASSVTAPAVLLPADSISIYDSEIIELALD